MATRVRGVYVKPKVPQERGLPKHAVPAARLDPAGVAGDFNHFRTNKKAGDPDMALLLLTSDVLEDLNREGWPVQPGDLGENLLFEGLAYASLQPGTTLAVGGAVVQVSKVCEPCDNLYVLPYVGEAKGPAFLRALVDRRGWYARVVRAGEVRAGDPVAPR